MAAPAAPPIAVVAALTALTNAHWPGNLDHLANVVAEFSEIAEIRSRQAIEQDAASFAQLVEIAENTLESHALSFWGGLRKGLIRIRSMSLLNILVKRGFPLDRIGRYEVNLKPKGSWKHEFNYWLRNMHCFTR